jgi:serine/threonine-protein kinase
MAGSSSPSLAGRREQICDRFEADWKAGRRPRIEEFWSDTLAPGGAGLLRELIVLELAYRLRQGERPEPAEYQARFPGQRPAVVSAFEAMHGSPGAPAPAAAPRPDLAPAPARSRADADRNLLFGVLALQMDFISREALIAAVSAWVRDKSKPLDCVLLEQGALANDERDLLEPLIRKHLERHGGDPERSLAAACPPGAARIELERLGDADIQETLARVAARAGPDPAAAGDPQQEPTVVLGAPTSLGMRFRILRPLARGGLGEVFVARDEELRREVALKAIQAEHAGDAGSRYRFQLEAEITGRLEHPGIIPVYGMGQDDRGRPYYAMRFIRGESLKSAIARFHEAEASDRDRDRAERALALRGLLGRFVDVCNAIAYAHNRGILHRDLKPANVMLGQFGETLVVDWGLAKPAGRPDGLVRGEHEEATLRPESASGDGTTQPGSWLGTPSFMSPEQAAGRVDLIGPASDVYSLGATLYNLLTGRPPFEGADIFTTIDKVKRGAFPPPRAVNPRVPPPLEAVCRKAMALRIDDRYPTPRALADDLEHWLADETVSAYREPAHLWLARWGRRHRPAVAGGAALLLTAVVALSVSTVLISREAAREEQQRRLAELNFRRARDAVDQMLTEVAEVELADVPQMQPVRKTLLEKARGFYQGFLAEKRTDSGIRREAARAHLRLGAIAEVLGDHVEAERAFHRGIELLDDLARDDPSSAEALRDLATGQDDLAMLLRKSNRFREAESLLRSAIQLREQLAKAHAGDAADRQSLADSRYHLAVLITRLQGRHPEDESAYREALAVDEALVATARDRPEHRRKLARTLNNLGMLLASTGRFREAENDYHEAIAILEGFVAKDPPAPGDRWQLARTQANLAVLLRATDRRADAEAVCLKAQALQKVLRADFPDVPDYRHELAAIQNNLGLMRQRTGRTEAAARDFREALEIQDALVSDFPSRPDYRQSLAVTRLNLASVLEQTDAAEATRTYQSALVVQERLCGDYPEVPEYLRALGRTLYSLAKLQLQDATADVAAARSLLTRAVRHHQDALAGDPRDHSSREFLRDDYGVLCLALLRSGAHAEAATAAEELPRIFPEAGTEYLRAAAFLAQCATTASADAALSNVARTEQHASYARRAVALLRQAVDKNLFDDPDSLRIDDLAPLRSREDFEALQKKLRDQGRVRAG